MQIWYHNAKQEVRKWSGFSKTAGEQEYKAIT